MWLIGIMLGALWTVTVKESQLGANGPMIHIVILSIILAGRWQRRWRPAGTTAPG